MTFRPGLATLLTAVSLVASVSPLVASSDDPESGTPDRPVVVLVYNTAGVPADTLRASEGAAEYVFSRAAVRTEWVDCSSPPVASGICRQPLSSAEVVVRLIRRADVPKARFDSDTLGFASAAGSERGAYSTVFYDSVAATASSERDLRLGLAHAITHELGHLFLRSKERSSPSAAERPATG